MQVYQEGSRWTCEWAAPDLRRFILDHVLLHEVGHHIYHHARRKEGLRECPGSRVCEQFAEDYARRMANG